MVGRPVDDDVRISSVGTTNSEMDEGLENSSDGFSRIVVLFMSAANKIFIVKF